MFPYNAITETTEIDGIGSYLFDNGSTSPKTVIDISIQQSGSQSISTVECGTETVAVNYGKDLPNVLMNYVCNDVLQANKTGAGDTAFYMITYVPYDTHTGSSSVAYANGFSYDGIFIGFVLLLMFMVMFFGGLWNRVDGIKKKKPSHNTYLGNNSMEGKIIEYD